MPLKNITPISLLILALVGCANNSAFLKASTKVQNGEFEGFTDLKRIVDENPDNVQYKNYYFKQRELAISSLNTRAETAMAHEQWSEARYHYQRMLVIDPYSERGLKGLKALALRESNAKNIQEAKNLLAKKDLAAAKEKLKWVINQEPGNKTALDLLDEVNRQIVERSHYLYKVKSKFKQPINLEFKEANLKDVFEVLSRAAGVNFVLDKELKGDTVVSVYVKNTTIDHALHNIFSANQLSRKILDETTVLVYPNKKKGEYEETVAKTFYLKSVEPKKAQEMLKTVLQMKDVFIDEKMNVLIVKDTVDNVRMVERLINSYDIGSPEVLLEVQVLEISNTLATELGFRWPGEINAGLVNGNTQTIDEWRSLNSGLYTLTIDNLFGASFNELSSQTEILANPKIRVKNQDKAQIRIGESVPVVTTTTTATGFVSENVNYLDVGLLLDVEPSIMVNDEVAIHIALEVSTVTNRIETSGGTVAFQLGKRNAETTLRLKNGETQMLAGLIQKEDRNSLNKVPGIGNLPLVGKLFTNKVNNNSNSEIVLLITPKIIRNLTIPHGMEGSEFSLGTSTGNLSPEVLSGAQMPLLTIPSDSGNTKANNTAVKPPAPLAPPTKTETLQSSLPPPPTPPASSDVKMNTLPLPPDLP